MEALIKYERLLHTFLKEFGFLFTLNDSKASVIVTATCVLSETLQYLGFHAWKNYAQGSSISHSGKQRWNEKKRPP